MVKGVYALAFSHNVSERDIDQITRIGNHLIETHVMESEYGSGT